MGIFRKLFGSKKELTSAEHIYFLLKKGGGDPDPNELFTTGLMFFGGEGEFPQNYGEAVKWFRKAADQGHREAQFCLAHSYHGGFGVPKNNKKAFQWFLKAAEQGHATSQRMAGIFYYEGNVVLKDDVAAVNWLQKAADQKDATASYNLGCLYMAGKDVNQDFDKALSLLEQAAAEGHEAAPQAIQNIKQFRDDPDADFYAI